MLDDTTPDDDRRAKAFYLEAKLMNDFNKLLVGLNSWPLAERRSFVAQWIDKLEREDTPVSRLMAMHLTKVWMAQ